MEDLEGALEKVTRGFHDQIKARAVVLLDPKYPSGEAGHIAGITTPEVKVKPEKISDAITSLKKQIVEFLKIIQLEEQEPRTIYISTEERRIYIRIFSVVNRHARAHNERTKTKEYAETFPLILGLTKIKDIGRIKEKTERTEDKPDFIFAKMQETVEKIQKEYAKPR